MNNIQPAEAKHEVVYLPTKALQPHPEDPRRHSKKQIELIASNIQAHGFNNPILIDENNVILAGHGRLAAATKLAMSKIPAIRLSHLTDAQKLAYLLADNKLVERGGWDKDLLSLSIQDLLTVDYEIELTGFSTNEIDLSVSVNSDEEIVPDLPKVYQPISQSGDLWSMGHHRLYCGDALDPVSYARLLNGKVAQMVFTDPPYNVPIAGNVTKKQAREFAMASGEMTVEQFTGFLHTFLELAAGASQDGAILYVCMDWRHMIELRQATSGLLGFKQLCVWTKNQAGMGSFYRSQHELIFVFKKGEVPHINNFGLGANGRHRSNVWQYPKGGMNDDGDILLTDHPTPKPVALVTDAIRDCSKHRGIILDPFMGSGTTLLAAELTGRKAYGLEIDCSYVDLIIDRWQRKTGNIAIHSDTGLTFKDLKSQRERAEKPQNA